ncbi:MAG: universal stress protein [Candidatus Hydrothermarchaeaceae archaeon]
MKILVPLKIPFAPEIAEGGVRLAKVMGAQLTFLNVADTRPFRGYIKVPEGVVEPLRREGEEILKEAVDLARKEGVKADSVIVEGCPYEEISKASKSADLAVLGVRRFSPEGTIGSVTKNVLVGSTTPIFVFKGRQEKFGDVLVAIDGSKYAEKAFEYALDYAKLMGLGSISAIFVARSPDKVEVGKGVLKEATKISKERGINLDTHLKEGDPAREILKFSDEKDVIIMSTTGKGTISRFFLGSVSSKVAAFSHCGVIIVPHRDIRGFK